VLCSSKRRQSRDSNIPASARKPSTSRGPVPDGLSAYSTARGPLMMTAVSDSCPPRACRPAVSPSPAGSSIRARSRRPRSRSATTSRAIASEAPVTFCWREASATSSYAGGLGHHEGLPADLAQHPLRTYYIMRCADDGKSIARSTRPATAGRRKAPLSSAAPRHRRQLRCGAGFPRLGSAASGTMVCDSAAATRASHPRFGHRRRWWSSTLRCSASRSQSLSSGMSLALGAPS
jgi:hypothetical protein